MIRFLASLNRPELDAAALDAAKRIGKPVHQALADGLGRRGPAAAVHVPALRGLGFDAVSWKVFCHLAGHGPELTPLAAVVAREGDPLPWTVLLEWSRGKGLWMDEGAMGTAVQSLSAEMRRATYWHLVIVFDPAKPLGGALGQALDSSVEAGQDASDPGAILALEVLQRLRGRPRRQLLETLGSLGGALSKQVPGSVVGRIGGVLDGAERKAFAAGYSPKDPDHVFDKRRSKWDPPAPRAAGQYTVIQTIAQLPPGFVTEVLESSGCDLGKAGGLLGGELSYGSDGRPRHAGVMTNRAGKECNEAVRALLVSTLAPLGVPTSESRKSLLLVPGRREFLRCLDETARTPPEEPSRVGSEVEGGEWSIQPPEKTRNVTPEYPWTAKAQRRQGVVVLDATISPTGCVSGISLLAGADTLLDLAAFDAVSGWAYTPTKLNGTPVPVSMTVTVNFRLN
jgi:TonB family protein